MLYLGLGIWAITGILLPVSLFADEPMLNDKIIIAHRGASGYLPEHTLAAKVLAYGMGVDFIEQDVVLSRDKIPVVLHDLELNATTNVKQVFSEPCTQGWKILCH